jgi:hypothetical protein
LVHPESVESTGREDEEKEGNVMKKTGALLVVILILLWEAVSCGAVTLNLMGPTKFTRDKGKPGSETVRFSSDFGGPATLKLINGSLENPSVPKISSATISLNGKAVFGPSDFNQKCPSTRGPIS